MGYVDIQASEWAMLVVAADRKGIDLVEVYRMLKEALRAGRTAYGLLLSISIGLLTT